MFNVRLFLVHLQRHIEVAVVFDRVSVGVENRGIPISPSLVTFLVVVWQTDVSTEEEREDRHEANRLSQTMESGWSDLLIP